MHTLQELFSPDEATTWFAAVPKPGLHIVAGTTGSGKSTTIRSTLQHVLFNNPNLYATTIAHDAELEIPGMALQHRATLIENLPDVVHVGEIRDRDDASLALTAAGLGACVLATLHIGSTAGAPGRLVGLEANRTQIAGTLNTVLSQRLMRKLCTACREPYAPTDQELAEVGWPGETVDAQTQVFRASTTGDCSTCRGGYFGRFAVPEIMVVTSAIRELIAAGAMADEITEQAISDGMTPLRDRALQHVSLGDTSIEELLKFTSER